MLSTSALSKAIRQETHMHQVGLVLEMAANAVTILTFLIFVYQLM